MGMVQVMGKGTSQGLLVVAEEFKAQRCLDLEVRSIADLYETTVEFAVGW